LRKLVLAGLSVALFAIPSAASAATATYVPTAPNYDTGINVAAGDTISAMASSDLRLCAPYDDCTDGHIAPAGLHPWGVYYIPDGGYGGGWYRIGDGQWTAFSATAGDQSQSNPVIAATSGRLYITTNDIRDDVGWCWELTSGPNRCWFDNTGTITATVTPTTAAQCKKDGWKSYGVFKNQGDCVSYVATNGENAPAGS
jgi:hypothetical protein